MLWNEKGGSDCLGIAQRNLAKSSLGIVTGKTSFGEYGGDMAAKFDPGASFVSND